jgi:hypothetical protein
VKAAALLWCFSINVRFEAFTATECNEVYLGDQTCENGFMDPTFRILSLPPSSRLTSLLSQSMFAP